MKRNYRKEPTLDESALDAGLRAVISEHERKFKEEQEELKALDAREAELYDALRETSARIATCSAAHAERTVRLQKLREVL